MFSKFQGRFYGNKVVQTPMSEESVLSVSDTFAKRVVEFYTSDKYKDSTIKVDLFKTHNITRFSITNSMGVTNTYDAKLFLSQILDKLVYDHMKGVHNWNTVIEFIFNQIYHRLPTNITQYKRKDGTYSYRLQCCKSYNSSRYIGAYKTLMEAIIE